MSAHTPTPWRVNGWDVVAKPSMKWHIVAKATQLEYDVTENEQWANAAHIVRCVNAHAQLLAALNDCREYFDDRSDVVDGDYGEPAPNKEMSLVQMIDAALASVSQ